jgi:antitoxin component YwqK of YwqJK toxin-antitoxin module
MRIELILLGVILLVVAIDFLVKKRKKNSSSEIEEFEEGDKKVITRPLIFKKLLISSVVVAIGIFFTYLIVFTPKGYKSDEVVLSNNLAYLKKDMSLLNGKINYSFYSGLFIKEGLFVNGKREGFHRIKYNYSSKKGYYSEYKWDRTKRVYTVRNRAEGEFIDNKYNGEWTFYHYYGKVHAKGTFKNQDSIVLGSSGVPITGREGLWRHWYENGQLEQEGNYVNGKEEGLLRGWHENGQLEVEKNYINGKLEGLLRGWHENGQLEAEVNYINNKREGLLRRWHENGQLRKEGNYINGKLEGLLRYWRENGWSYKGLSSPKNFNQFIK